MTVDELIAELEKMPRDAKVWIDGYEYGIQQVDAVELVRVQPNVWSGDFGGKHDVASPREEGYENMDQGVYLPRDT